MPTLADIHILIVEDHPEMGEYLLRCAKKVTRACLVRTHSAAVNKLQGEKISVVLYDFGLPDATGIDGLRRLMIASDPSPTVVVHSAAVSRGDEGPAYEAGAFAVLPKPTQAEALVAVLRVACHNALASDLRRGKRAWKSRTSSWSVDRAEVSEYLSRRRLLAGAVPQEVL